MTVRYFWHEDRGPNAAYGVGVHLRDRKLYRFVNSNEDRQAIPPKARDEGWFSATKDDLIILRHPSGECPTWNIGAGGLDQCQLTEEQASLVADICSSRGLMPPNIQGFMTRVNTDRRRLQTDFNKFFGP